MKFLLYLSLLLMALPFCYGTELQKKKHSFFKPAVGGEVYFFKFEDKISEFNTEDRDQKLDYNYKPVITTNVSLTADFYGYLSLTAIYGSDRLSLGQNNSSAIKPPENAPAWMRDSGNSIYGIALRAFDFKFNLSQFKFTSGTVDVIDVSADPQGEVGEKVASFNNSMEFRDAEISYGVGKYLEYFFRNQKSEERSDFTKYFLLPLQISYVFSQSTLPVIPYFFTRQNGQLFFEEGKIQQIVVRNSMVGVGWDWKYAQLNAFFGSSHVLMTDENDQKKNLKTDGNIVKFRAKYDWEPTGKSWDWVVTPYGQMSHYDFNDDQDGDFTIFSGSFFVYQVGLNVGVKL